jgi:hypothetical protein
MSVVIVRCCRGDHFRFSSVFIKKSNQNRFFFKKETETERKLIQIDRFWFGSVIFGEKTGSNWFGSVCRRLAQFGSVVSGFFRFGFDLVWFSFFGFRLIKPN